MSEQLVRLWDRDWNLIASWDGKPAPFDLNLTIDEDETRKVYRVGSLVTIDPPEEAFDA